MHVFFYGKGGEWGWPVPEPLLEQINFENVDSQS